MARSEPERPRHETRNAGIAAIFEEIADLLEIEDANPFRVRAYRNAARVVKGLDTEVATLIARGDDLTELPGIGKDLAAKMADIAASGTTPLLDKLHHDVPPELSEFLRLPGLGPKRVKLLHDELDIQTLAQLQRAAKDGRLAALPGFGARTQAAILAALESPRTGPQRLKLASAAIEAEALVAHMSGASEVKEVVVAGSFRRAKETVGDLDLLVVAERAAPVMARFAGYGEVARVVAHGAKRGSVVLRSGLAVDLRIVAPESFGAALVYFTGSKAHNIAIRRIAQASGLKINEYGVFRGERSIAGRTEEDVYREIGLAFIPPELREDRGEIEAAREGRLPRLIERDDLRGDLHVHTTATDGLNSLEEMAAAAKARGLDYVALTEHSRRLAVAHGLDPRRLAAQIEAIDRFNRRRPPITVLTGIEVDILGDGRLDLPDAILARLDLVIGAVHSQFGLSRERQTERILRAMDHPSFTILAHPSGRLIGTREPYDVDMAQIIRKAKARGCFLELNAHPERLDLLDTQCRMAKAEGVLVAVNSDAHSMSDYDNLRYGIAQARRGWLEKDDVLNTRTLARLRPLLARAKQAV